MKKSLAILFVLLSLLSFVAITYSSLGTLQFLMLGAFVVLAGLIVALRNRNIDALIMVFFLLGLLDSAIILTKGWFSMKLVLYAFVNIVGLMLPLTGTDVRRVRRIEIRPVDMPEPEAKFVASKSGTVYHNAKCNWVDNIKEANKVWFKTAAQARSKGYKKHKCKLNNV